MRFQPRLQAIWSVRGTLSVSGTAASISPMFISAEQRFSWSPSRLWQALWGAYNKTLIIIFTCNPLKVNIMVVLTAYTNALSPKICICFIVTTEGWCIKWELHVIILSLYYKRKSGSLKFSFLFKELSSQTSCNIFRSYWSIIPWRLSNISITQIMRMFFLVSRGIKKNNAQNMQNVLTLLCSQGWRWTDLHPHSSFRWKKNSIYMAS